MNVHCILPSSPWLADSKTNIPLGLLYIAASLREAGHQVSVTSLLSRKHNDALSFSDEALGADLHLVSMCTPQFNEALEIAAHIKDRNPHAILIAGGPHASYEAAEVKTAGRQEAYHIHGPLRTRRQYYAEYAGGSLFDSVVLGEGENIIHKVLADVQQHALQPYYYGDTLLPDVNAVPYPAWDLLPADHIHNDGIAVMKHAYYPGGVMSLIGTRGCPFHCTFCSGPRIGLKPRFRSPENVLGEMRAVMQLGVRMFKFQDDTMTWNKKHLDQLSRTLANGLDPGYAVRCHTRVNVMDDEIATILRRMNTKVTCFGFESGSQQVLDRCHKRTTVEQGTQALQVAKAHGFYTIAFLVFGLPGETEATMHETMRWLESVHPYLDSCNLAVTIPYPGSQLWAQPYENGIEILNYNYDSYWIVGFASREEVLVRPLDMSAQKMVELKARMFQFLCDHGWAKPEWAADATLSSLTANAL
jgi:radical SAM superfamily enzyme YgiQ (UPF0313 family)